MKRQTKIMTALLAPVAFVASVYVAKLGGRLGSILDPRAEAQQLPTHQGGDAKDGGVVVQLCDGVTKMQVPGLTPGQKMTREQALAVTRALMADWQRQHPDQHWEMAQGQSGQGGGEGQESERKAGETARTSREEAQPKVMAGGAGRPVQQGDTYASFSQRDLKIWQANTDRFVAEGKDVFHDANKLGGTIGISCDMCHPDAANTHPETYPKYQVQLQRVALLRDMIEWCIENPIKGKTMDPNDERLRALEAYILAQRKGVPLEYGKH